MVDLEERYVSISKPVDPNSLTYFWLFILLNHVDAGCDISIKHHVSPFYSAVAA